MGKIFPSLKNLQTHPQLWEATLTFIEENFAYDEKNSFENDFITLMNKKNAHHLYILQIEEEIVAHLGVKIRDIHIGDQVFKLAMMGGIAVSKKFRGQGYFSYLMSEVKSLFQDQVHFFMLWSDLAAMYEKHGFYLCGSQFSTQGPEEENTFSILKKATPLQQNAIKKLQQNFFNKNFIYIQRTEEDWDYLFNSTSVEIWIDQPENIESYFIKNKGQDLKGIIHEFATIHNRELFLKKISSLGTLWSTRRVLEDSVSQYQFLIAGGDKFNEFISSLTDDKLQLRHLDFQRGECEVLFQGTSHVLKLSDFYTGVFGPNKFEELSEVADLYITGWDSI